MKAAFPHEGPGLNIRKHGLTGLTLERPRILPLQILLIVHAMSLLPHQHSMGRETKTKFPFSGRERDENFLLTGTFEVRNFRWDLDFFLRHRHL